MHACMRRVSSRVKLLGRPLHLINVRRGFLSGYNDPIKRGRACNIIIIMMKYSDVMEGRGLCMWNHHCWGYVPKGNFLDSQAPMQTELYNPATC